MGGTAYIIDTDVHVTEPPDNDFLIDWVQQPPSLLDLVGRRTDFRSQLAHGIIERSGRAFISVSYGAPQVWIMTICLQVCVNPHYRVSAVSAKTIRTLVACTSSNRLVGGSYGRAFILAIAITVSLNSGLSV